jgi:hypothetical protein
MHIRELNDELMMTYRNCDFKTNDLDDTRTRLQHAQDELAAAQSYVHHLEIKLHERDEQLEASLAQAIALILESRNEQTELLQQLMANSTRGGNGARNAPAPAPTTYGDFAATHPPLFTEAGEPLEVDHWLRVMESKFGLLHYTEV